MLFPSGNIVVEINGVFNSLKLIVIIVSNMLVSARGKAFRRIGGIGFTIEKILFYFQVSICGKKD